MRQLSRFIENGKTQHRYQQHQYRRQQGPGANRFFIPEKESSEASQQWD
jgi:hypothetical protein